MKFHKITVHASSLGVEFIQGVLMGAEAECFEIIDPTDLQELLDTQYVPFDYVDDALLETKEQRIYLLPACSITFSIGIAFLYERLDVIASNVSTIVVILAK